MQLCIDPCVTMSQEDAPRAHRSPKPSGRPTFTSVVQTLSQPTSLLLHWTEEDRQSHPRASCLGAVMEAGRELYPDLQMMHSKPSTQLGTHLWVNCMWLRVSIRLDICMCQYFVLLLDRGVSLMYSLSSQHCKLIISYYDHYLLILCSLVIVMKFLLSSCGIQIREDRTYLSTEQNNNYSTEEDNIFLHYAHNAQRSVQQLGLLSDGYFYTRIIKLMSYPQRAPRFGTTGILILKLRLHAQKINGRGQFFSLAPPTQSKRGPVLPADDQVQQKLVKGA